MLNFQVIEYQMMLCIIKNQTKHIITVAQIENVFKLSEKDWSRQHGIQTSSIESSNLKYRFGSLISAKTVIRERIFHALHREISVHFV